MSGRQHKNFETSDLLEQFRALSRAPFQEVLSDLMQGAPNPNAIQNFADQHPDRWVNAVKGVAKLAGYHDKLEIQGNIHMTISTLGDAQLMDRLEELDSQLLELTAEDYAEVEEVGNGTDPASDRVGNGAVFVELPSDDDLPNAGAERTQEKTPDP